MLCELATYLHQINPYAIKLWEGGPVRWYGLSYLLGFYVAYLLFKRIAKVGITTLGPKDPADLIVTLAMGIVIGGRLGYVLFYKPAMLWGFSSRLPFWDVLAINNGGMASHGGMIGMILACWWYAKKHGHALGHLIDLGACAAPLGVFFGRIANFVNGELLGRACSPNLPWGVKFPQEIHLWDNSLIAELARQLPMPPSVNMSYPSWFIDQVQQGNTLAVQIAQTWVTTRHPSQIYQALLEGLLLWLILMFAWRRPRKPLFISGLFVSGIRCFGLPLNFSENPIYIWAIRWAFHAVNGLASSCFWRALH